MIVKAKTSFFYDGKLYKKNDELQIRDKDFNGINMVKVEEAAPVEEVKPAKTSTKKTTTKKTSTKKSK